MQTFHPAINFAEAARLLDYKRLGKQRLEAFQILVALGDEWATVAYVNRHARMPGHGYRHHPATLRWIGAIPALHQYYNACVYEWVARGYNNTMPFAPERHYIYPRWLTPEFVSEHRRILYRKDPIFYEAFHDS
jgi:hypothetical protein